MGCDSSKDLKVVPNHSSKNAGNGLDADPEEGEQKTVFFKVESK